jgi:hypothetical protein
MLDKDILYTTLALDTITSLVGKKARRDAIKKFEDAHHINLPKSVKKRLVNFKD